MDSDAVAGVGTARSMESAGGGTVENIWVRAGGNGTTGVTIFIPIGSFWSAGGL
ncbi:MAG: hypothetical protein ACI4EX_10480 [Lachnospiraceae bacterium]